MSSAKMINLNSFDDLFGTENTSSDIIEVPLDELHSFKNHPFKVIDNEDMNQLVESIKLHGKVLQPGLVRTRPEGGYELISGHRRKHACMLAGLATMPVIVRDLSDDESTVIMVDSNIQREHLLYSEKAFAYKMKFEAMSHPGFKMEKQSLDLIGEESGESGRNVQRYIRLTELIPELLNLMDEGKLGLGVGVDLSFLDEEAQSYVFELISGGTAINCAQAAKLKKQSQEGFLSYEAIVAVLLQTKPTARKVVIKNEKLARYFSEEYTEAEIEEVILSLLEKWKG